MHSTSRLIMYSSIVLPVLALIACCRDVNTRHQTAEDIESPMSVQPDVVVKPSSNINPIRINEELRESGLPSGFLVQGALDRDGVLVFGKLDFNSLPQTIKEAYKSGSLSSATGWEEVSQPDEVYLLDRHAGILSRASQSIWATGVEASILTIGSDRFRIRGRSQEQVPWPDGTQRDTWPAPYTTQLPDAGWVGYGTYVPGYKASAVVIAGDKSTSGSDIFGGSWSFREGPYYLSVNVGVGEDRSRTSLIELVTHNEEGGFTCMYTRDGRWCIVISGTARELWIIPLGDVLDDLGAEKI